MADGSVPSDQVLVRAVATGDPAAFTALYRRHVEAVRSEIRRTSDDAVVADLTQDVFLRALEALPSLRDASLFRPWVISIARRRAIDQRRARRPEQPLDEATGEELADAAVGPGDVAELRELAGLVRGVVAGLSRRDATAVRLVTDLGFSPDELGPALGVSGGAARVILHRARRRLRDALVLELLVRREAAGCTEFVRVHAGSDIVAAAGHVRACDTCRDSARHELGLSHVSGVQSRHADPGLS